MKKTTVLSLIASTGLLIGSILNLLNSVMEIPDAVKFATLLIYLATAILYVIVIVRMVKEKRQKPIQSTEEHNHE